MLFFDIDDTLLDHKKSESMAILDLCNHFYVEAEKQTIIDAWVQISKKYYTQYLQSSLTFDQQRLYRIRKFFSIFGAIDPITNLSLRISSLQDTEIEAIFDLYLKFYEFHWYLFDDVCPALDHLKQNERLGIITNGQTSQQIQKLKQVGISEYFELVVTSHTAGVSKPDKELFIYATSKCDVSTANCYYIGDDLMNDAVAATNAGMKAFWLNRTKETVDVPSNVTMITSLKEISEIFCNSPGT